MTTPDPEPRRVEPTGNPRVDALIDAIVCPSCRTIYNAAKAKCADPWHSDNRPGVVNLDDLHEAKFAERLKAAMATQRVTVLPPTESEREQAAYERGVAEGRRQAAEGWEREWGTRRGRVVSVHITEAGARRWSADVQTGSAVVSRLVGPWEPAEQDGAVMCPHGYERGDHHWFGCMKVDPFAGQNADDAHMAAMEDRHQHEAEQDGADRG